MKGTEMTFLVTIGFNYNDEQDLESVRNSIIDNMRVFQGSAEHPVFVKLVENNDLIDINKAK